MMNSMQLQMASVVAYAFRGFAIRVLVPGGFAMAAATASAQCIGTCGTAGANGDVITSPVGGSYSYVATTFDGPEGGGSLPGVAESTNGSQNATAVFSAAAGASLSFYFNYITSDGDEFSDYSWAQLQTPAGAVVATLFSARTTPLGDTVPGFGLPPLLATLTPASTPILNGTGEVNGTSQGPVWAQLGADSGLCYSAGCGLTGWIRAEYTIADAGMYRVAFGVSNSLDPEYQSGFAYSGVFVDGTPVPEVPESSTYAFMLVGLGALAWKLRRRVSSERC